jgi:hypothetical protein
MADIEGKVTVVFLCKNGERRMFAGVYYIPWLMANIVSVGQLDEAGYDVHIKEGKMNIRKPSVRLLAWVERASNRLYVLTVNIVRPVCLATRGEEEPWWWHAQLGHVSMPTLRMMAKEEMVQGLPDIEQVDRLCEACLAGKQ